MDLMTRYGWFFAGQVGPFTAFLNEWHYREAPADAGSSPLAASVGGEGMAKAEWLIQKLVDVDPDGVAVLHTDQRQALAIPQSKDERAWSRTIVDMIDNAFKRAEFSSQNSQFLASPV